MARVLVIDDDINVLQAIQRQLENEDIDLNCERNPVKALNLLNTVEYDIILCDIKMQPMSGLEVLREIKQNRPTMSVIIITGFFDDEVKEKAKKLGTNDFLMKPILKKDLIAAINNVPKIY